MTHIIPPFSSQSDPGYKFLRVFAAHNMYQESVIEVRVEGGVSPYDWELSDDTYLTLGSAQTAGQTNTVTSAVDAPIGTKETVTITDAEMSEVTIEVCVCGADCCEDCQSHMEFDDERTADSITHDTCIDVYMKGGCPQLTWEIISENDDAADKYSLTEDATVANQNELCAGGCIDDEVTIKVTDDCGGELEFSITGVPNTLSVDTDNTPATIDPGGWIYIYVSGGEPPYTWVVSGTGFSIRDSPTTDPFTILDAASGVCDVDIGAYAEVTITDDCGNSVVAIIRNTGGEWVQKGYRNAQVTSCTVKDAEPASPCYPYPRNSYGLCYPDKFQSDDFGDNNKAWTIDSRCRPSTKSYAQQIIDGELDPVNCMADNNCLLGSYWSTYSGTVEDPPCGTPVQCGGLQYECWLSGNCANPPEYCDCGAPSLHAAPYRYWYYEWECP